MLRPCSSCMQGDSRLLTLAVSHGHTEVGERDGVGGGRCRVRRAEGGEW